MSWISSLSTRFGTAFKLFQEKLGEALEATAGWLWSLLICTADVLWRCLDFAMSHFMDPSMNFAYTAVEGRTL